MYPKNEGGYAITMNMNVELVLAFKNQTFTKGSAILRILFYEPESILFQNIPKKKQVGEIEGNRLRNGNETDTLTSVYIQENVNFGGEVIEI